MAETCLIQINQVEKVYPGRAEQVHALNGVTQRIESGEFIAITGRSGSGKSTLLSILGGLSDPTNGKVSVDTIDVYTLPTERLADFRREYIGFVFQSFQLIPYLTVMENIMLPLAVSRVTRLEQQTRASALLEKVGLKEKANRLPDELSGGEQQRVAIARALVNEPLILLADEPTGNLDSATSEQIMDLFTQLNEEGLTIIMVTHNTENLRYARRCIELKDGLIHSGVMPL